MSAPVSPSDRRSGDPSNAAPAPESAPAREDADVDVDAILASSRLPAPQPAPDPDDPLGVTIHRLRNGLTVYLSTHRVEPRFHAWIAIRAGARHDPPKSTGLAHYLEHMMFKGSSALGTLDIARERPHLDRIAALYDELRGARAPRRDALLAEIDLETQRSAAVAIPNELDRVFAALGVLDVNAFTAAEETVYTADVPAGSLAPWARLERARFTDPVFRLFYPELESVYEEKNMSLDDPNERVYEAMMDALFAGHPYGTQPTLGRGEHLRSPAYADMVAFFGRWYAPNNAAIVLAGDIDAETALPVLEREFADWRPRPLARPEPGRSPPPPSGPRGRVLRVVRAEGEESVTVAWRTPALDHPDTPTLRVLDRLVDNATCGLLNVKLRLSQLVPDAHAGGEHRLEAGYWSMTASARTDQPLDEVEALLLGIAADLRAGEFSDDDLAAVKLHARIHDTRALESNESRAARMAEAFTSFQPWPEYARRTAALDQVTRADVIRAAQTYLQGDFVVVRRESGEHRPPQIRTPKITPVPIDPDRESALAREVRSLPTRPPAPAWLTEGVDYSIHALGAGPCIAVANPLSDLFTVELAFPIGLRQAPLLRYALDLFERAGVDGDAPMSAPALQRALYRLGTTVDTWCGPDLTTLSIAGVRENLEPSLALALRWLRAPRFSDESLRRMLDNRLSRRRGELHEPDAVANALADYARHGDHGWTRLRPSNAALAAATGDSLRALLAALPDYQRTTLYFGPDAQRPRSPGTLAALRVGDGATTLRRRPPLRLRAVSRPTVYFVHKQTAQAQVQVVLRRPPMPRATRPLARLYDHYLGGDMSGLVFQELREARGLAYAATARHELGLRADDPSAILGLAGTQCDKVAEAVPLLLQLVRRPPIQPARVEAVRAALIEELRSTRIEPRGVARRVFRWRELGEPADPRPRDLDALTRLRPEDLARFVAEIDRDVELRPPIIGVMGDRALVDLAALAALGELVELTPEQLFSFGEFPVGERQPERAR
ncbi:MAG: insulinase family protein [Myxococcales bacterium]|nr:insulinase family protein [Myxococcales bacterium]